MKRVCCAVLAALLLCLSGCGVQSEPEQLSLFNEPEVITDIAPTPAEPELTTVKAHKRKKHATNEEKLPEDAEIEVVTLELPADERVCPQCGEEMPVDLVVQP